MSIRYYQQHAESFFTATVDVDMRSLYAPFIALLPAQGTLLDAGCGSGRDSKAFKAMGYDVEAFDATAEMVALAAEHTGIPVRLLTFAALNDAERYDGIWCCASLLHVPSDELPEAMQKLADALKPGGVWYVSFKYGNGEREKDGRHFTDLNEQALEKLVSPLAGIRIHAMWRTEDKRPDRDEIWLNALLRKA
ncbi:bifunctional 2-polyprenyl-6-hydroxyphenol methylase/3-demethylubiquinol 3-O-methyltransferase UbiG [Pluralibacter sp.]|uniref:class I SAM-dependent methyltransferase n=1 Tax=Pluralibacter sp. TaxID=1920032 RepID=UPI0025DC170D|nr:class I SAM-dependent methyltransferase [Pluralibacter sp.]MBV8042839.1 class I SAM-dependent methyltransferase [Pluralibacter sp.]